MKVLEQKPLRPKFYGWNHAAALLKKLLQHQEATRYYQETLREFLEEDPARLHAWEEFQRQGGVTSKDLWHWCMGNPMPSAVEKKQHLRLVSDGGEAA